MKKQALSIFLSIVIILVFQVHLPALSQESIELKNIEAPIAKELLPKDLNEKVTVVRELNSLIFEGNSSEIKRLQNYIKNIDKPLKHVELEVKLIEFKKENLRNIRFLRDTLGINSVSGFNSFLDLFPVPLLNPSGFSGGISSNIISGPIDSGILIGNIPKGLSIFNFSRQNWNVFNKNLSFLETKGIAQIHAYPKIVTIAGRPATININQHNNVILGSATRITEFGVANTQKIDSIKAGTNLLIIPTVSNENLITNKIQIDLSENSIQRTLQSNVIVPTTTFRREIDTDIQVVSGQTVAIGGLILNNKSTNKRGFPFITSIPFVGNLLSNRNSEGSKTELIVFITPKIIELSNAELKNLDGYNELNKKILKQ